MVPDFLLRKFVIGSGIIRETGGSLSIIVRRGILLFSRGKIRGGSIIFQDSCFLFLPVGQILQCLPTHGRDTSDKNGTQYGEGKQNAHILI